MVINSDLPYIPVGSLFATPLSNINIIKSGPSNGNLLL